MSLWINPPYYLTAYGIAVKHGFYGTEEEWLQSLKGEKGDPGGVLSVNGKDGVVALTAADLPAADSRSTQEHLTVVENVLDGFVFVKNI